MPNLDRAAIGTELFRGSLSPNQSNGVDALLSAWAETGVNDNRQLAYLLATVYHETGRMMQPLREGFAKDDAGARAAVASRSYGVEDPTTGQVYYGRGLIQLTWAGNYRRVGEAIGLDLYRNPDLALDGHTAAKIAALGMVEGLFSGRSLKSYFNALTDDPVGARQIINGSDRAELIAGYHATFLSALS